MVLHCSSQKVLLVACTNMVMVNIGQAPIPEKGVVLHANSFFAIIKYHGECPFVKSG